MFPKQTLILFLHGTRKHVDQMLLTHPRPKKTGLGRAAQDSIHPPMLMSWPGKNHGAPLALTLRRMYPKESAGALHMVPYMVPYVVPYQAHLGLEHWIPGPYLPIEGD